MDSGCGDMVYVEVWQVSFFMLVLRGDLVHQNGEDMFRESGKLVGSCSMSMCCHRLVLCVVVWRHSITSGYIILFLPNFWLGVHWIACLVSLYNCKLLLKFLKLFWV